MDAGHLPLNVETTAPIMALLGLSKKVMNCSRDLTEDMIPLHYVVKHCSGGKEYQNTCHSCRKEVTFLSTIQETGPETVRPTQTGMRL